VQALLSRRARIEAEDNSEKTALHYAAENGLVAMAQLLLEKGANVNVKDGLGNVDLDYALEDKHEVVGWLLNYGPKTHPAPGLPIFQHPNSQNNQGNQAPASYHGVSKYCLGLLSCHLF
jgi:ankyrin repeat protein